MKKWDLKKFQKRGKTIYERGQKLYQEFEKRQAISKAKELQKLRVERLRLEGKMRLGDLKEQEQKRIMKAKKKLGLDRNKKERDFLSF